MSEYLSHLKNKVLSSDDARFYAASMLLALQHIHKKGFVHRNLMPENVLLGADGFPKLALQVAILRAQVRVFPDDRLELVCASAVFCSIVSSICSPPAAATACARTRGAHVSRGLPRR